MKIFLVRHGESLANIDHDVYRRVADHAIPLSERGQEQAREAGRQLNAHFNALWSGKNEAEKGLGPAPRPHIRLWTSPYLRTRQTADCLMAEAGEWFTDRKEHILLCEQQFGLFEGIPDEELPQVYPNEYALYQKGIDFEGKFWVRVPMGESRFDVATRVHQSFGTFQRDRMYHGIEHIVVVCHGVTLRAFTMMWCHLTPEWFEAEPNPSNCAIRLIESSVDRGYLFKGFPKER